MCFYSKGQKASRFSLESYGVKPGRIILKGKIGHPDQAEIKELADKIFVPVANGRLSKDRFRIRISFCERSFSGRQAYLDLII